MARFAVCQDDAFWNACSWTTANETEITSAATRDAYYVARYTSLQAYVTAQAKLLTEPEFCEILGPWATPEGAVTVNGFVPGLYCWLSIVAVGVARPGSPAPYKIAVASGNAMSVSDSYVLVDGVYGESSNSTGNIFNAGSYNAPLTFRNCIAKGGAYGFWFDNNGFAAYAENCLAINSSYLGFHGGRDEPAARPIFVNCTAYNATRGFDAYYNSNRTMHLINCIAVGCSVFDFTNGANARKTNCISSDTTASTGTGSAGNYTGRTAAEIFTNAPGGDFTLPSTSFARGKGVRILTGPYEVNPAIGTTPKKDIVGNWRHNTPDIGAYEYDDGYVPGVSLSVSGMAEGSVMAIYKTDGSAVVSPTVIDATGSYTGDFGYTGDTQIVVRVRKGTGNPKYLPYEAPGLITAGGFSLIVNQVEDTIAS